MGQKRRELVRRVGYDARYRSSNPDAISWSAIFLLPPADCQPLLPSDTGLEETFGFGLHFSRGQAPRLVVSA